LEKQSNEYTQLVALIAHNLEPSLDVTGLQSHCQNTLVFTHTLQQTSTMIMDYLFGLMIVDVDLNGVEILTIAKRFGCMNRNTPIVALVSKLKFDQAKKLIAEGFDDCLTKPLTTEMLDQAIKFWQKTEGLEPYKKAIETVLSKCNNNKKLILSLYLKLFEELPQQISNIEEALNKKQYKLAFDITHKFNGSVKICSLQELQELAMALEMCLIQRNYAFADGYFLMLQQQVSVFMGYRQPILAYLTQMQNI